EAQPHGILRDPAVDDLDPLLEHLDSLDPAQRAIGARDHAPRGVLEALGRGSDQLVDLRHPHGTAPAPPGAAPEATNGEATDGEATDGEAADGLPIRSGGAPRSSAACARG